MSCGRHTILGLLVLVTSAGRALGQTTLVQFIHASPYAEAKTVDVYIDGVRKLDDFEYGSATSSLRLPAARFLKIEITPGDAADNSRPLHSSFSALNAYAGVPSSFGGGSLLSRNMRFFPRERFGRAGSRRSGGDAHLLILAGDPLFRAGQPGFDVFIRTGAYADSDTPPLPVTIYFAAAPGLSKVNVSMKSAAGEQIQIPDLKFGDFSYRHDVAPVIYDVSIEARSNGLPRSFVQDYRDKANRLVVNVVSGLDMEELFMVLPDGTTVSSPSNSALVQFIHNNPSASADSIDIYVNDRLTIDGLSFGEATPFVELPAGLSEETAPVLKIDVTRTGDADNAKPLHNQEERYLFDEKVVSVLAVYPDPADSIAPMKLLTHRKSQKTTVEKGFVDLLIFHGSSNMPAISVGVGSTPYLPLVRHLDFGIFASYSGLPLVDMTLLVSDAESGQLLAQFDAPLASLTAEDSTIVLLTSATHDAGEGDFTLVAALPSGGRVLPLNATIPTPWWQSLRFIVFALAGLVVIVVAGTQIRIRRLRARERELGELVLERTRDLEAEKKRTEEQADRLLELDRAKNRFFANISHEFRTPITLILGPLQDLHDGVHGKVSRRAQNQIGMVRRNARRLLHLVNQLLDLARIDAGQPEVHYTEVDFIAHLGKLVQSFAPMAEHEGIRLELNHDCEELPLESDPDMLDKVFGNLLSNALKFTPRGGRVWVTVNEPKDDPANSVEVVVKDTGPGIKEDHLSRIFDRFVSVSSGNEDPSSWARAHEGVGIGLSLARELVELHGGLILVESEPGFGSAFTVRLPSRPVPTAEIPMIEARTSRETEAVDKEAAPAVGEAKVPSRTHDGVGEKKRTVLIVEDNPDVRTYIRTHLADDYILVETSNGQEGLEAAKRERPDLVLADIMMPVMDGYALCRAIKAHEELHNVPVVLLTAKAGEEDTLEGLRSGADDYITKPFSMPEVKARLANLMDSRRQMREQYSRQVVVQPAGITIEPEEKVFLDRVLEVINAHLGDSEFGVEWLANEVGMSPRQLRRRLEDVAGEPPAELIRRLRLARARDLLTAHAGTVSEVAYAVGFKSASHFSLIFKETFGVTPTEHVENHD